MKTKIILVGGFLGAGKTTMLWNVAKHLSDQGIKVGLITNDQASELVDTTFLESTGGVVSEVSGSCFCCNFNGFTDAIQHISDQGIDMIVAEPVGICTDLSATILQPLKEHFADSLSVAPLSALEDENVEPWLEVVQKSEKSGTHLLEDINYDTYAEGEAVLGWLNATVQLRTKDGNGKDWKQVLTVLLRELSDGFGDGCLGSDFEYCKG